MRLCRRLAFADRAQPIRSTAIDGSRLARAAQEKAPSSGAPQLWTSRRHSAPPNPTPSGLAGAHVGIAICCGCRRLNRIDRTGCARAASPTQRPELASCGIVVLGGTNEQREPCLPMGDSRGGSGAPARSCAGRGFAPAECSPERSLAKQQSALSAPSLRGAAGRASRTRTASFGSVRPNARFVHRRGGPHCPRYGPAGARSRRDATCHSR